MADFYSVNTGNWNNSNSWSDSSDGSPGVGIPSVSDTVYITSNGDITVTGDASCYDMNLDNGNLIINEDCSLYVSGTLNVLKDNCDIVSSISGNGYLYVDGEVLVGTSFRSLTGSFNFWYHTLDISIREAYINSHFSINSFSGGNLNFSNGVVNFTGGTITVNGSLRIQHLSGYNHGTFNMGG